MASSIEWLDGGETWNPIRARLKDGHPVKAAVPLNKVGWACVRISPGCQNCYSETQNEHCGTNKTRLGTGLPYNVPALELAEIYLDEKTLLAPLHWKKGKLIFPCSMTDWMADFVPDEFHDKMLAVMALTQQHTYLTLTKRADRQRRYLTIPREWYYKIEGFDVGHDGHKGPGFIFANGAHVPLPLPNLWLGTSVEDQQRADERIPLLLQTPAAVRWISAEPLLGPVDLKHLHFKGMVGIDAANGTHGVIRPHGGTNERIDWAVIGGESGPGARPMHPDWARSLRDQCKAAGVPFFFKQWGAWAPGECGDKPPNRTEKVATYFANKWDYSTLTPKQSEEMHRDDQPDVFLFGKKAAGRKLDGVEHSEYPVQRAEVARARS